MEQQLTNQGSGSPDREPQNRIIEMSNGDIFRFPMKFKGKHRRGLEKIRMGLDSADQYPEKYPELLMLLMESAKSADGKDIQVTNDYIDDLPLEDYMKLIDNGIQDLVMELAIPKVS